MSDLINSVGSQDLENSESITCSAKSHSCEVDDKVVDNFNPAGQTSNSKTSLESAASTQRPGETADATEGLDPNLNVTQTTPSSSTSQTTNPQTNYEQQLQKAKRDLEGMVLKYAKSERENLQNKNKVDELDKKLKRAVKDNDQLANRIKLLTNDKTHLTETLNAKVAQLTVLEQKNSVLSNVQGVRLLEHEEKIKKLEKTNEDLLKQIESYKSKEGELLDFSERLSMKHIILQSELDEVLSKAPNYKDQYDAISREKADLLQEKLELLEQLEDLKLHLAKEKELTKSVKEDYCSTTLKFRNIVDELNNEIKVMRRKHKITTKELVKEVKLLQSQLENSSVQT